MTIEPLLEGKDLIGVAKTGSGKTLAYGLPILLKLAAEQKGSQPSKNPKYLVLGPTRQLVQQIKAQLYEICQHLNLKIQCVFGGEQRWKQLSHLRNGADVLIATPGRLIDFIESKNIILDEVKFLTLDEADRILEIGYEQQINQIARLFKVPRQTTLFSATWDTKVKRAFKDYMRPNPEYVQIGDTSISFNLDVEQIFENVDNDNKLFSLIRLLKEKPLQKFIVFCNMKYRCQSVGNALSKENLRPTMLQGNMDQKLRDMNLNMFRENKSKILIATDVASRGLDISDVTYIVNYDMPDTVQSYIHRIGRTARAGKKGRSISYINRQVNKDLVQDLLKLYDKNKIQYPKELLNILPVLVNSSKKQNKVKFSRFFGDDNSTKPFYQRQYRSRDNFKHHDHRDRNQNGRIFRRDTFNKYDSRTNTHERYANRPFEKRPSFDRNKFEPKDYSSREENAPTQTK